MLDEPDEPFNNEHEVNVSQCNFLTKNYVKLFYKLCRLLFCLVIIWKFDNFLLIWQIITIGDQIITKQERVVLSLFLDTNLLKFSLVILTDLIGQDHFDFFIFSIIHYFLVPSDDIKQIIIQNYDVFQKHDEKLISYALIVSSS